MEFTLSQSFKRLFETAQRDPFYKRYFDTTISLYNSGEITWQGYLGRLNNLITQISLDEFEAKKSRVIKAVKLKKAA